MTDGCCCSTDRVKIQRALISVSDKTGLIPLAQRLAQLGVQIISTGGTAKALQQAGIAVTPIDQVTGFPEMMDGRVKTLHPKIHGGLLGLRDNDEHLQAMKQHGIQPIDLVCVNLYPFEQTVAKPGVQEHEAIEQIDIGGPSMVRSGAKNHRFVTIVTDASQYEELLQELNAYDGATTLSLRRKFCAAAFAKTAAYDTAIAAWMEKNLAPSQNATDLLPPNLTLKLSRLAELRYGENPHQSAAVYATSPATGQPNVVQARQLHGKELSFNNLYDAAAALELVREFDQPAAAVIKHTNPCGCAQAKTLTDAFEAAYAGDPVAAFGGIVALSKTVDVTTAQAITSGQKFLEVIVAPDYEPQALEMLKSRWQNVRLLAVGDLALSSADPSALDIKWIPGGALVQQRDRVNMSSDDWKHVAGPLASPAILHDLAIAWKIVKHVKSNAIVLARHGALVGAGAGQMDRIESCKIAVEKANARQQDRSQGAVAASDAFFPFRDGPDVLIRSGVKAIVQPGGSKRDEETIQACNEAKVTLMFTGRRHFRH